MLRRVSVFTVAAIMLAGCAAERPGNAAEPTAPGWVSQIPVSPLPQERNGIEAVPVPVAQEAVLEAMVAQVSGIAEGEITRLLTDQETTTTSEAVLAFSTEGNESAFQATATWGDYTVSIVGSDDAWWMSANSTYAEAVHEPDLTDGMCMSPADTIASSWRWLAGPAAVFTGLSATGVWGAAVLDEPGGIAVFPVTESGAVVGSVQVAATGAALPVSLDVDDPSGRGQVRFGDWSDDMIVAEPPCVGESPTS